jgi:hypothetical protein
LAIISSGQITLTDLNDSTQLYLYLNPSASKIQIYDPNGPIYYNPDFTSANFSITPELYIAGNNTNLLPTNDTSVASVTWYEGNQTSTPLAETASGTTPNGLTYTIPTGDVKTTAKTLTIKSNITANNAIFTCVVIYNDTATAQPLTIKQNIEITKITNGTNGTGSNAVSVIVTNDNVTLTADSSGGVISYAPSTTDIHVYDGTAELIYDGTGTTSGKYKVTASITNGTISAGTIASAGVSPNFYATVPAASLMTTDTAKISYRVQGKNNAGTNIDLTKEQTYSKAKAGGTPTTYSLNCPTFVIKKNGAGTFSPTNISISAVSQAGTSAPAAYNGVYKVYTTNGTVNASTSWGTAAYTTADTTNGEASTTYPNAGSYASDITGIKVELWTKGASGVLVDSQVITVVSDGQQNVTGFLTNQSATLAADYTGAITNYGPSVTDIHVYDGTSELKYDGSGTLNGTYKINTPALTTGTITTLGSVSAVTSSTPNYATVSAIAGLSTDTATITFTIVGKNNLGVGFTITQVQSIARAKSGQNGTTPTAYSLVAPNQAIKKDAAGTYSPTNITVSGLSQVGSASPAAYSTIFKFYTTNLTVNNSTAWGTATTLPATGTATSVTYPATGTFAAGITGIKVEMYDSTGTTVLDSQVVPIISDGSQAITSILTNDTASVATDSTGGSGVYSATPTDIHVYDGGTELKYVTTAPAAGEYNVNTSGVAPVGITAGSIAASVATTPIYAKVGAASLITADTATITFTISGKNLLGQVFSTTKVQSISRTKNGADAGSYWCVPSPSAISQSNLGVLTPTSVTCQGFSQVGTGAVSTATSFKWVVGTSTNGIDFNDGAVTTGVSATSPAYPAGLKAIRFRMYLSTVTPNGNTNMQDEATVWVVADGQDSLFLKVWGPKGEETYNSANDIQLQADLYKGASTVLPTAWKWYMQDATATVANGAGDTDGLDGWRLINGIAAAPTTAPTLAAVPNTSTLMTAQTYYSVYTWTGISGETLKNTTQGSFALAANNDLKVSVPSPFPANATSAKIYVGTVSGGPYYYQGTIGAANGVPDVQKLTVTSGATAVGANNVTVTVPGSAGVTTSVNGGAKEVDTLTVTAAAGTAGNVTITLNGVAVNIAVAAADAATTVATKIAAGAYTGWTASAAGAVVTFTKSVAGTVSAPVYSAGTTGATGTFVRTTTGVNPDSTSTIASNIAAKAYTGYTTSVASNVVTFTATTEGTKSAITWSAGSTGVVASFATTTAGTNDYLTIVKYNNTGNQPPTTDSALSAAVTGAQLTVKPDSIPTAISVKCVATAPTSGTKYTGIVSVRDFTDPIIVQINGVQTFKNGQGTAVYTVSLAQNGAIISNAGYTFNWALWNADNTLAKDYSSGATPIIADTITVPATDVNGTGYLVCKVIK